MIPVYTYWHTAPINTARMRYCNQWNIFLETFYLQIANVTLSLCHSHKQERNVSSAWTDGSVNLAVVVPARDACATVTLTTTLSVTATEPPVNVSSASTTPGDSNATSAWRDTGANRLPTTPTKDANVSITLYCILLLIRIHFHFQSWKWNSWDYQQPTYPSTFLSSVRMQHVGKYRHRHVWSIQRTVPMQSQCWR